MLEYMSQRSAIQAVLRWARRNGAVITRAEALLCGANDRVLAYMVDTGVLLRAHRGVYVLPGAERDPLVAIGAALAAAGRQDAFTCHMTAGWLQGLLEQPPGRIHVAIPRDNRPLLAGTVVHRYRPVPPIQAFRGFPCTTPARTIVDMASIGRLSEISSAIDRGLAAKVLRLSDLAAEAAPSGHRRRGAAAVRKCLERRGDIGSPTPSVLESVMARLFHRYGLPTVKAEVHAGPDGRYRIDYAFPRHKLAIELYGYTSHHSPEQLAYDVARQRKLTLEGWKVLIYTWQEVTTDPARVAAEIRAALSADRREMAGVSPRA